MNPQIQGLVCLGGPCGPQKPQWLGWKKVIVIYKL